MGVKEEMAAVVSARSGRPPRLRRRTVTLEDGHRVGVAVCGEGVPLLFVHGLMADGMLYARVLRRIAGLGFRVVAIDSAGHGATRGLGTRGWRWDAYVDLHRRVIDHLGIRSAVLMGHSMGGRVAVDLAADDPDRALAVIPVNAAIGPGFDRYTTLSRRLPLLLPLAVGAPGGRLGHQYGSRLPGGDGAVTAGDSLAAVPAQGVAGGVAGVRSDHWRHRFG